MNRQVGIYEYGVSPYHLKPLKGLFNPGIGNNIVRNARMALFVLPPFAAYYSLSVWADKTYEKSLRKGGKTGGH
ncbi:hypothetical protein HK105_206105 [Polyrhizophydium stewartii]|uniref:Cytochrome b-c1 complex subunit 8 n=1 Tax=Polyrhizophydium stewartii TaxID=2732419 RepID=A0ABR4N469_9FUNG|nr:hypothetical protein HK105_002777 [Polyrhizophydium stewartii]